MLEFPQSSNAFQVRVIVLSWGHAAPTTTSVKVMVGVKSQLSVAPAVPVLAGNVLALHCMVILIGQEIIGAVLSSMIINCIHVLEFPQ